MSPSQRAVFTTWRCLSGWSGGSVATVPDDGAVEELAAQGADPAFGERVRHGSAHRRLEDLHAFGSEDLVEGVDELACAVAHECQGVGELVAVLDQQVPGGSVTPFIALFLPRGTDNSMRPSVNPSMP